MNQFVIVGFLLSNIVLFGTIFTATDKASVFLDYHGLLIVVGGTFAAAATSFQLNRVFLLLQVFFRRSVLGRRIDFPLLVAELMQVSDAWARSPEEGLERARALRDPFLIECLELLKGNEEQAERIIPVLEKRRDMLFDLYMADAHRFRALGKYPPAMGLLGAVTGMISMLAKLDGAEGGAKGMGGAMAVALVATFYGIAFANFFLLPIAENLTELARETNRKNTLILDAVKLIAERSGPGLFREHLNSHLLPGVRVKGEAA